MKRAVVLISHGPGVRRGVKSDLVADGDFQVDVDIDAGSYCTEGVLVIQKIDMKVTEDAFT